MPTTMKQVGSVTVETGSVMISDPVLASRKQPERHVDFPRWTIYGTKDADVAINIQSGMGDGVYPVWAELDDETGRVLRVEVRFWPHPSMDIRDRELSVAQYQEEFLRRVS